MKTSGKKKTALVGLPAHLKKALDDQPNALAVFQAMRPSCQKDYAARATAARASADPEARLATVVRAIKAYGQRHPEKFRT